MVVIGQPAWSQGIATMYQEIHSESPQDRQRIKRDMQLENKRINAEATKKEAEELKLKQEKYARKHHQHLTSNSLKSTKH